MPAGTPRGAWVMRLRRRSRRRWWVGRGGQGGAGLDWRRLALLPLVCHSAAWPA